MSFYTLLRYRPADRIWSIEYGSSAVWSVYHEIGIYRKSGIPMHDLRIMVTPNARSATITAAIAKANGGRRYPAESYHYNSWPWSNLL